MTQSNVTDGGRTDTKRFENDVNAEELIEGDRIEPKLVARHPDQLGEPLRRTLPNEDDDPETQLVVVTALDSFDDVHSALLLDPEAELFVRASKHDSNQAWTQAEADWTVRDVGAEVIIEEVHKLERPEQEQDEGPEEYVQRWVEILFGDIRNGHNDYQDERELEGTTLTLRDFDGRKTMADIRLEA